MKTFEKMKTSDLKNGVRLRLVRILSNFKQFDVVYIVDFVSEEYVYFKNPPMGIGVLKNIVLDRFVTDVYYLSAMELQKPVVTTVLKTLKPEPLDNSLLQKVLDQGNWNQTLLENIISMLLSASTPEKAKDLSVTAVKKLNFEITLPKKRKHRELSISPLTINGLSIFADGSNFSKDQFKLIYSNRFKKRLHAAGVQFGSLLAMKLIKLVSDEDKRFVISEYGKQVTSVGRWQIRGAKLIFLYKAYGASKELQKKYIEEGLVAAPVELQQSSNGRH